MELILTHMKSIWPVIGTIGGFLLALIIGFRYKIPALAKKVKALEEKGAKNRDLDLAIDSFHTVCRFNQVSCQKEVEHNTSVLIKEFNEKQGELYEKLNRLAVKTANLTAKVEILVEERANGALKN